MSDKEKIEVRDLRNGDWYWIHRAVIRDYTRKVGAMGIMVYNFLASLADSGQGCFPSQKHIAQSLGYSRSYVNETLKLLERNGLIRIEKKGRHHCVYHLLRLRCQPERTKVSTIANLDVHYTDTNDNTITRNNNDIVTDMNYKKYSNIPKGFEPRNRRELLALDLANALDDRRGLALYLSYTRRFPEPVLRRALGIVKEIPSEKIRKSRAAFFNYLICRYAKSHENHRD